MNEEVKMKRDPLVYGIIGFLMGAIIVLFLATNTVNNNVTNMMQMMGIRNSNQRVMNSNTIDAHFIEQMIPHHEDAITMAKLALEKASHPEIKRLAQDIVKAQSDEIAKMKGWYRDWFGTEVPKNTIVMGQHGMTSTRGMHMGMMGNETDIEALRNASNFDQEFIEQMIPHHQMAVMMTSMLKNGTQRSEMKQLADDIITAQTREIDQMREWLQEWQK